MKIDANRIPLEGLILAEGINASALDLETDEIKFHGPINIKADISKITNTVTVDLSLNATMSITCSRCLEDTKVDLEKKIRLAYPVSKPNETIDLNPDIREEIILDYPLKPLCMVDCKGLCPRCGKNLNEGGCSCATT